MLFIDTALAGLRQQQPENRVVNRRGCALVFNDEAFDAIPDDVACHRSNNPDRGCADSIVEYIPFNSRTTCQAREALSVHALKVFVAHPSIAAWMQRPDLDGQSRAWSTCEHVSHFLTIQESRRPRIPEGLFRRAQSGSSQKGWYRIIAVTDGACVRTP
jgi:hypothetical protein